MKACSEYYYFCIDQTICVISPNITTLTIRDGLARDIEFHCQCMDDNGMMITGTRWFFNGSLILTRDDTNRASTAPYYNNTTLLLLCLLIGHLLTPHIVVHILVHLTICFLPYHLEIQLLLIQEVSMYTYNNI